MKDFREQMQKAMEPGTPHAAIFYGILGLIIALLLLIIGLPKTLLILVCCLIGAFLGGVKDKAGFIRRIVERFYRGGH